MAITLAAVLASSMFRATVRAETFKLDDGKISFAAPQGFKPLSQALIRLKYPRARPPRYVIGNKNAATTIAYDLKPRPLPKNRLQDMKVAMTRILPRLVPGLTWLKRDIITLSGQKWLLLELTSTAIDTDIYNIMLFTSYKGRMLAFNFNSTKKEFPKYDAALRRSIKSIRIK